jgi:hypothetical protein
MRKLLLLLAGALAGLSSCDLSTTKVEPTPAEITYYSQLHYSQNVYNDVVSQVLYMANLKLNNPTGNAEPDGVTISDIVDNVMTIEYKQGVQTSARLGKIKVTFSGTPLAEGSSIQVQPDGLSYSGMKVSGDIRISILEKGTSKAKQGISISAGTLTDSYGSTLLYACNLTREQKEGESDKVTTDDTYTFTGSMSGEFSDKKSYSATITDPLVLLTGYAYFKSGKLSVDPFMYASPFQITFGTTTYINQVLLTYQGVSKLYTI